MKKKAVHQKLSNSNRHIFLLCVFVCILFGLTGRLAHLHVVDQAFLQSQGEARAVRVVQTPAYRGMIKDRNGEPLAVSTPVSSIWMNPQKFQPDHPNCKQLADLLAVTPTYLEEKLKEYSNKEFVYLSRHISPGVSERIQALKIPGINSKSEYRRFYPAGEVNSHVLGFTDIDDHGQEGLELAFDEWLTGHAGKKKIIKDRLGREVEYLESLAEEQSGKDLSLSIDQRIQYLSYRALKIAVDEHRAVSGSAVVLDVRTGEVLAMVNQPTFNPNKRTRDMNDDRYRNRAVTDYFEPGSVIKAFSMASVLEHGQVTPASVVDTRPGLLKLPGGVIRDISNNGKLDVANILRRSSNIGIAKLVLDLSPGSLWETYDKFGFGYSTNSGFPGESAGILSLPHPDQSFVLATMAFGYGMTVTPLQLARAYAILGNGGIRRPVSFVKLQEPMPGLRVMSPDVAREVMGMLAGAVEHERSNARVSGYHVAGKTGTARKVGKDGYERGRHRAVFGGLAPAINPQFAIVVTINEPSAGQYYSNQVAAPVFSKIAAGALRLFNIQPDLLDTQGVHIAQNGNRHS